MKPRDGSKRLYRALLRCYPSELREHHAEEMEKTISASFELASRGRWLGASRAWIAALRDLVRAWTETMRSRRGPACADHSQPQGRWARLRDDTRYGLRTLRRSPGLTAIAVVTLTLGIGANAALFTVVDAVLLQPLPYPEAERLMAINVTLRDNSWWSASPAEIREWRQRNQVFEEIAFARLTNMTLADATEPVEVLGARVSANMFRTLSIEPLSGRDFEPAEGTPGAAAVAVISDGLWRRRYAADPDVIGRTLRIDGIERRVVGVLPPAARLAFLGDQQVYVPVQFDEAQWENRGKDQRAIGRLRKDVTPEQASADMDRIARQIEIDDPQPSSGWGVLLVSLKEQVVGPLRPLLMLLIGAVAFVLLIACANTSNLLLARATSRRREFAVRLALGAGTRRVRRQMLTEACLLAAIGGACGLLFAVWGTQGLLALAPDALPLEPDLGAGARSAAFTLLISLASGLLLGVLPARRAAIVDPGSELRAAARATGGAGILRLRSILIAAEVAIVLILLIGAGLTLRSFAGLLDVDPGFEVANRVAVRISLPQVLYPSPDEATAFFDQLSEEIGALPGVRGVGTISNLPFATTDGFTAFHIIESRALPPPGEEPLGGVEAVSPGYFGTLSVPLVRGRGFGPDDERPGAPAVAIINEAMWRHRWPDGEDPIGERILFAPPGAGPVFSAPREIVGVVQGVQFGLGTDVRPRVYTPSSQLPFAANSRYVVVATDFAAPESIIPAVRAAVRRIDPGQSVALARTLDDWRSVSLRTERFQTLLLALFGGTALLLGAAGVYGVVSYSVSLRQREAGIRMALGADGIAVFGWVLRGALTPVMFGIVIGMLGAAALAGLMSEMLFDVPARDPATFAAVAALLLIVATVASLAPARRAVGVDPLESLRSD